VGEAHSSAIAFLDRRSFSEVGSDGGFFLYIFVQSRCLTYTKNMAGYGGQSPLSQQYWYVYILKCKDGSIYTGCTNNLEDRIKRHNLGQVLATKFILPAEIVTYIAFTDKYKAYAFERYLKLGSGRAFSKRHLV
jgi:predicted GIY-YIG superfamily endonuclease